MAYKAVKKTWAAKAKRGPRRSVPLQLTPARFDRDYQIPQIEVLDRWTTYIQGPQTADKYAVLPITEVIPTQRPPAGEPDDRFRSFDTVLVKGVSIRMTINHAESVRLMVHAFRNGMRAGTSNSSQRPYADRHGISDPPVKGRPVSEIVFDVMSKEKLMGMPGCGKYGFRNLGVHDRPFAVSPLVDGRLDWYGPDFTAFTSRFSTGDAQPVGKVYATINGGKISSGSSSVNERPLELFVGFDSPGFQPGLQASVASGAIMAMDMKVYYE
ncbi:uncharacterized protein N7518_004705 [Penicillium psychrosexuale]|uniref:uncharacterized protein n=1 Tax=Penicillium psychrosexuale TaxID=1002107 RepID=UPI002545B9F2|nr:uncharacterized protein N7518_004705 [Penicillium psychrosexuale]KAJ5796165.1 hypothetical protein N7518_004705 [Penicillium psychrosexuale]